MKRSSKRRISVLIQLAAVMFAADTTAQVGPTVSGPAGPGKLFGNSGPPPTLVAPAAGTKIATGPTSSTPVIFRWSVPSNAPAPQRYRLCVAQAGSAAGTACSAQDAAVYEVAQVTTYQAQVPPRFHDKALQWTVAACGAGYGGGVARMGATNTDCSTWAQPRSLDAGYQPPSLNLQSPLPGVTASMTSQRFTWSGPTPGSPGIDGYRFCLADNVSLCQQPNLNPTQGVFVSLSPADRTFADVPIEPLLRGGSPRQMEWTVLSCKSGNCRLAENQPKRSLLVGGAPPVLTSPANGTAVRAGQSFEWSPVDWASYYVLCVSSPGVACPDPTRFTETQVFEGSGAGIVFDQASVRSANASTAQTYVYGSRNPRINVVFSPMEGERHWTVAACWRRQASSASDRPRYCAYQNSPRSVRIHPRWNVSAKVSQIQVHKRCDNISPGDWNVSLFLSAPSSSASGRWPGPRGSRDVKDNEVVANPQLRNGLQAHLRGLGDDETVSLLMSTVDCDSEGAWTLSNVFSGIQGVVNVIRNWTVQCGGEELQEVTFDQDQVGEITHQVRLENHRAAGSFRENVAVRSGPGDCGPGAYTATFEISGSRN